MERLTSSACPAAQPEGQPGRGERIEPNQQPGQQQQQAASPSQPPTSHTYGRSRHLSLDHQARRSAATPNDSAAGSCPPEGSGPPVQLPRTPPPGHRRRSGEHPARPARRTKKPEPVRTKPGSPTTGYRNTGNPGGRAKRGAATPKRGANPAIITSKERTDELAGNETDSQAGLYAFQAA